MKRFLAVGLIILAPAAASAQPFSESMADCAALHQNAAQWATSPDAVDRLIYAAKSWADAAFTQATQEGRGLTKDSLWELIDSKTQEWEDRGGTVFFTQDFRDWTAYCRSFAKDRGIQTEM
ncbi:hypothetical protein [Litoreibacter roseus]|nr:hypothetical protein [Litoreibacter roseus]